MKRLRNLPAALAAVLLAACAVGFYLTRDTGTDPGAKKPAPAGGQRSLMDDRLLQTASRMAATADTAAEQDLAREAQRLSDHEMDQAFATALREATEAALPLSPPLQRLAAQVAQLKARVTANQARIAQMTKEDAAKGVDSAQLDLAKAQLELDQDQLDEAQEDLARQGGDPHAAVERALQQHEAANHVSTQLPKLAAGELPGTLREQAQLWLSLRDRRHGLEAAAQQAASRAGALERQHSGLEDLLNKPKSNAPAASPAAGAPPGEDEDEEEEDTAVTVARLHRLSDQRKTLAELDKRIQDARQLAEVYGRWIAAVETRERGILHLLLRSLAAILAVVLLVLLLERAIRRAFDRQADRRRLHQLRVMVTIAVEVAGAALVLLIVFGPPTQITTMIGLLTAGLTVVLKDFILAFFGWFVLMGRNGIHVGDWVEINGVGGEVIEIGLLRTVLLEIGSSTGTGHPTGRRVAFVNSFAVEGHYFNFSTAGQWLWDQLQLTLPPGGDAYDWVEPIRRMVERETEADARLAEQDWERVTRQYGTHSFSARPAVDLRPSATGAGLDVVVRYITRAHERYALRSRLFQLIVDLLRKPAGSIAQS